MTRPPDRLPQSARDRELRTAITRGDASSSPGRTGFARQAPRDPAAAVRAYTPPPSTAVAASAMYLDSSITAYGVIAQPSTLDRSDGPADVYFAYDSGAHGIALLQAGWYQISATGLVTGATPGDVVRVFGFFTTPQTVEAVDVVDATGSGHPVAMALPFYDDGSGTVIQVETINQTGIAGHVASSGIYLVAFA